MDISPGLKAEGIISHSIDLPTSSAKTAKAGWYLTVGLRTPKAKQAAAIAALDAYFRGIVSCGKFNPVFVHIALSQNDPELMVIISAWPSEPEGRAYYDVSVNVIENTSELNANST
jgi:hypothetical protein